MGGRIKTRYYISDTQPKELDSLESGRYVSMFGNVRTAPYPHFVATGLRLVQSADEISYHMIESAHSALKLQNGVICQTTSSPMKQAPHVAAVPEAPATKGVQTSQLEGAALREAIVALLRQEAESKPEGSAIDALLEHAKPTPEDHVRSAIQQLVDDGEVFTTIDDDHFSCV